MSVCIALRYAVFSFLSLWMVSVAASPRAFGQGAAAHFSIRTVDTDEVIHLYSQSHALVIGIDKYDGRNDKWSPLVQAVNDAVAVANALEQHDFKVTLLVDRDVRLASGRKVAGRKLDRAGLQAGLSAFVAGPGSIATARIVIWFAGHGHTLGREGYIVPQGAPNPVIDINRTDPQLESKFRQQALSMNDFAKSLSELKARHVLAIFDSCFSGRLLRLRPEASRSAIQLGNRLTRSSTNPVRYFIASGDADQFVPDNGQFRRYFIDALAGRQYRNPDSNTVFSADENDDGYLTTTELGRFLASMTSSSYQFPQYGRILDEGFDEGEVLFQVLAATPGATSWSGAPIVAPPKPIPERTATSSRPAATTTGRTATSTGRAPAGTRDCGGRPCTTTAKRADRSTVIINTVPDDPY